MRRFTCPKCNATAEREAHQATSKYCVECRVWMEREESVDDRPVLVYVASDGDGPPVHTPVWYAPTTKTVH